MKLGVVTLEYTEIYLFVAFGKLKHLSGGSRVDLVLIIYPTVHMPAGTSESRGKYFKECRLLLAIQLPVMKLLIACQSVLNGTPRVVLSESN